MSERKTQRSPAILFLGQNKMASDDIRTSHTAAGDGGDFGHQRFQSSAGTNQEAAERPIKKSSQHRRFTFRELLFWGG